MNEEETGASTSTTSTFNLASYNITMSNSKAAVFRAVARARRTSRRFQTNRPIPDATLRDILETTLRSPSSFNMFPLQIVMVRDDAVRQRLANDAMLGAGNAHRTRDCSALAVFLADLEPSKRLDRIMALEEGRRHAATYRAALPTTAAFWLGEGHAATWLKQASAAVLSHTTTRPMPGIEPVRAWAYKNTALAAQSYILAATSYDLATAAMEGFDPRRTREILCVPDRYAVPIMVATGYEYFADEELGPLTPRLGVDEIVFDNTFGVPLSSLMSANHENHVKASDGGDVEKEEEDSSR